jgi:hypothetical protein
MDEDTSTAVGQRHVFRRFELPLGLHASMPDQNARPKLHVPRSFPTRVTDRSKFRRFPGIAPRSSRFIHEILYRDDWVAHVSLATSKTHKAVLRFEIHRKPELREVHDGVGKQSEVFMDF